MRVGVDFNGVIVGEPAREKLYRQRVLNSLLDHTFERPGAINRVVPFVHNLVVCFVCKLNLQMPGNI